MAARINNRPIIRLSPVHSRQNSSDKTGSIYQQLDPLLSNLSPESTLQALTSTDAVPSNEKAAHDILSQSISQVSPAERALGIRAAVAAQNLDLWHKEVQSWTWPSQHDVKFGKGFIPPPGSYAGSSPSQSGFLHPPSLDEHYYGSLPASVVERNQKRIEEIRDGMDNLNVEELKEHVLNAHIPSRSRPSSATSSVSVPPPLSYVQLSDFTAVVTATILRALPFLARLNALLTTWDVRLLVLRQIPGLLRELSITRSALDSSLHALRDPQLAASELNRYSDESIVADHVKLESAVVAVGRRMDRVLDALEGRPDSLPEQWIDDLESIESDFAAWVVQAEKYKVQNQWLRSKADAEAKAKAQAQAQAEKSVVDTFLPDTSSKEFREELILDSFSSPAEGETSNPELNAQNGADRQFDLRTSASSIEDSAVPLEETVLPSTSLDGHSSSALTVSTSVGKFHVAQRQDNLTPVSVTDDFETPTQSHFPPDISAFGSKPPSALASCVSDPNSENKENIPPLGYQQADGGGSPVANSPTRANVLSENTAAICDTSVQHPALIEADTQRPQITVAEDVSAVQVNRVFTGDKDLPVATMPDNNGEKADVQPEAHTPHQPSPPTRSIKFTPRYVVDQSPKGISGSSGQSSIDSAAPATASPVHTPKTSETHPSKPRPSMRGSQIPLASPKSGSNHTPIKPQPRHQQKSHNVSKTVRKPLQSPIKLSDSRSTKLDLDRNASVAPKISHRRRTSTGSVGSLLSDHSSLISSPDAPEPRTASSSETQLRPSSHTKSTHPPSHGVHTLREDRLRHLENQKPDLRVSLQQNRSVSLPLERFINERLELGLAGESEPDMNCMETSMKRPITSSDFPKPPKSRSTTPVPGSSKSMRPVPRTSAAHNQISCGKSASDLNAQNELARRAEQNRNAFAQNTARRAMEHQAEPKSLRLRKRLTAHPSLESLGVKRQELSYVEEHESELTDFGSRASSPTKHHRQPRDHLDEKISSILNSLPGHIHLVDSNHEADTSSSSSSIDRRIRYRSESPSGFRTRSATPAPSLTLMPAARRRHSHAYKAEDSCVKLYHLHHGGQAAPTKLFVRTVGEEGQRVMVRVGGGWADLGEYLREYVIHHGRRKVSETPRVEVQGIKTRSSPSYTSPGTLLPPVASAYITSGRATPSLPPSVLSARPPSSLTVQKKRRGSTASDIMGTRAVTTGHLNSFTSPPPMATHLPSTGRRLSVSSGHSVGEAHSPNTVAGLPSTETRSTPLGLAGPKPRARYESMSPEGEAWVADVLQKTRRSSSQNVPHFTLGSPPYIDIDDHSDTTDTFHGPSLPKVRSIGDIGSIGTSRRVVLKGLGRRS